MNVILHRLQSHTTKDATVTLCVTQSSRQQQPLKCRWVCSRTRAPESLSSIITCCSILTTGSQTNNHRRTVKSDLLHALFTLLQIFQKKVNNCVERIRGEMHLWERERGGKKAAKHLCLRVDMHTSAHTMSLNRNAQGSLVEANRVPRCREMERENIKMKHADADFSGGAWPTWFGPLSQQQKQSLF